MSIDRIDFPNAAPVDITDWEKIIDVAEFNTLGINNPVPWDFLSNTVKQGVRIIIGGTIYQVTTDEAITGTPSDFVRITPAGATASAAYVASLAGVTWNSVYNHYDDVSGNAYIFNESKQFVASPKTEVGKWAELGYVQKLLVGTNTDLGIIVDVEIPHIISTNNQIRLGSTVGTKFGVGLYYGLDGGGQVERGIATTWAGNVTTPIRFGLSDNPNVLIGTIVDSGPRLVVADEVGSLPSIDSGAVALFQNNLSPGKDCLAVLVSSATGIAGLHFGDSGNSARGRLIYNNSGDAMSIMTAGQVAITISNTQNVLIKTVSDPGEGLHVGAGGMRVTGTTALWKITPNGRELQFSAGTVNYISGISSGDSLSFVTNGRSVSTANSNMNLNADQSVTVNTTLLVDTIAEKTASAGISFSNTTKWKKYYTGTGKTNGEIFTAIESWVPNTGDVLPCTGDQDATGAVLSLYRINATQIRMNSVGYVSNSALGTALTDGGVVVLSTIEIMSNFDAVN